jgi:hypothetical protein
MYIVFIFHTAFDVCNCHFFKAVYKEKGDKQFCDIMLTALKKNIKVHIKEKNMRSDIEIGYHNCEKP